MWQCHSPALTRGQIGVCELLVVKRSSEHTRGQSCLQHHTSELPPHAGSCEMPGSVPEGLAQGHWSFPGKPSNAGCPGPPGRAGRGQYSRSMLAAWLCSSLSFFSSSAAFLSSSACCWSSPACAAAATAWRGDREVRGVSPARGRAGREAGHRVT